MSTSLRVLVPLRLCVLAMFFSPRTPPHPTNTLPTLAQLLLLYPLGLEVDALLEKPTPTLQAGRVPL